MKTILTLILIPLFTIVLSGCSTNQSRPLVVDEITSTGILTPASAEFCFQNPKKCNSGRDIKNNLLRPALCKKYCPDNPVNEVIKQNRPQTGQQVAH